MYFEIERNELEGEEGEGAGEGASGGSGESAAMDGRVDSDLETGLYSRRLRRKRSLTLLQKILGKRWYQDPPAPVVVCFSLSLSAVLFMAVFMYNTAFGTQLASRTTTSSTQLIFSERESPYLRLQSLVMVAGHAVYTSSKFDNPEGEDSWFLEPYQQHRGQASTFVDDVRAGVEAAAGIPDALLLFSGGETRKDAGPRSEAQSYWNVAESKDWFGKRESVRWRTLTEEFARDSFENLMFSLCRFRELTGHYPTNITVVSYDFKQRRFTELHRHALGFPESKFSFVGVPTSPTSQAAAVEGESKVLDLFREDPYGCKEDLRQKRISRDPFVRAVPYPVGCPEMRGLFGYCGPDFYVGNLPWNHQMRI